MQQTQLLKVGSTATVTIEKLVYKGVGLGSIDTLKVFVPKTIPQDVVEVTITKRHRRYAEAKITQLITPSPLRAHNLCAHYPDCGGCQMIDVAYSDQLALKQSILDDAIHQFYPNLPVTPLPIVGVKDPLFYRNKMDYSFGMTEDNTIYLGLKKRGRFDVVIPTPTCQLQSDISNQIRAHCETYFNNTTSPEIPITAWDYTHHTGLLRHLVIRHAKTTNEILLNFVVSKEANSLLAPLAKELITRFPEIRSIFYSINETSSDTSFTQHCQLLEGTPKIKEDFGSHQFLISPQSFFQTNSFQAKVLYDLIVERSGFQPSDTILDLYCGTGTIGLFLAPHVHHVIGIEENPHAIQDAETNAVLNNIHNITFHTGRVKNILKFNAFNAQGLVIDPPRAGIVPKALKRIIDIQAPKITYVSCNPVTLLRDLLIFAEAGYTLTQFQPVDMFPHTYHLEVITTLVKE